LASLRTDLVTADEVLRASSVDDGSGNSGLRSIPAGGVASGAADSGNPVKVGGKYNLVKPTLADGQRGDLQLNANGAAVVEGALASGVADAGLPVKVGAKFNSTPATLTDGWRSDLTVNSKQALRVALTDATPSNLTFVAPADGLASTTGIPTIGQNEAFNGTTWDDQRSASATNLTQTTSKGVTLVAQHATWSAVHAPAANTQATASKSAGAAGVRHVCTGFSAALYSGSTAVTVPATPVTVTIRDGASGAGTILWQHGLSVITTAGGSAHIALSGLSLVGTAATAMTIEFSAAGGAGSFETVSMQGYSVA
jgi:hypothetical protein